MSGRRREPDDVSFAELVGDARPLEDRERHHEAERAPRQRTPARASRAPRVRFLHDTGPGSARAEDTARREVARLRGGEPPVDRELDLHGLRREAARRTLLQGIETAVAAGQRCLLVIHGRGHGSAEGPVLREALPEWLEAGPRADRILAYAPAPPARGGAGATLVLLRRAR